MIGLVVTVYNRPQYLERCLQSLDAADLSMVKVVFVDDASTDPKVSELLSGRRVIRSNKNKGVALSLRDGFDYLIANGFTKLMNLDADAVVSRNFVSVLNDLHETHGGIVTGFNTLTCSERGNIRHPIVKQMDGYCIKKSIGGINMMFNAQVYANIVRPALSMMGHWDWNVVRRHRGLFICSSPSVVEHIGFESSLGNVEEPDKSIDFVDKEPNKKVILQPFGLGDIIFCQTIAHKLGDVIWPVLPQFYEQVKRAYPAINFTTISPVPLDIRSFKSVNGYDVIPIRFSDTIQRVPYRLVMRAKYDMLGMDYRSWKDFAGFERDLEKEKELARIVGADGNHKVVNRTFTRDNRALDISVGDAIEMRPIEGFSLFDWSSVLETATEIDTVSTSVLFTLSLLQLRCKPRVYVRKPLEKNHQNYDYIFGNSFIYM